MAKRTYRIAYYAKDYFNEDGDYMLRRNWREGTARREWKRAVKIVYWLRRRGVMAFAG